MSKLSKAGFENPNHAPKADRIIGFKCDHCEHLHVALMNKEDRCIATAIIDREMLEGFFETIDGPPTMGETAH